MSIDQQLERWNIFQSLVEQAKKEGLILCMGDMNINLNKIEDPNYYLRNLADEYQTLINECQLEVLDFGITWTRIQKNSKTKESAVDHAITNKIESINSHFKIQIDYSDHSMICVDLIIEVPKILNNRTITCRDF